MNDHDIELLSAYIDNELNPDERAALEKRMEQDPSLRAALREFEQSQQALLRSVGEIENQPLSPGLAKLLGENRQDSEDKVVSLASRRPATPRWLTGAGIAAAALLAVLVFMNPAQTSDPLGPLVAEDLAVPEDVADAMALMLTGDTVVVDDVTLSQKMAFESADDSLCKHFLMQANQAAYETIVCRESNRWFTQFATRAETAMPDDESLYRPASGDASPLQDYISRHIQGTALTRKQEKARLDTP